MGAGRRSPVIRHRDHHRDRAFDVAGPAGSSARLTRRHGRSWGRTRGSVPFRDRAAAPGGRPGAAGIGNGGRARASLTPRVRPSATGRHGRCHGAAPAAARARCRARLPGHGPADGRTPPRGPGRGSGPGPACPSTTTDRPRPVPGRPAPSWRACVPRHTAWRAVRGPRHCGVPHCGVHRSPLHSQPGRTAVPVERTGGRPRATTADALLHMSESSPESRRPAREPARHLFPLYGHFHLIIQSRSPS